MTLLSFPDSSDEKSSLVFLLKIIKKKNVLEFSMVV